MIVGIDLGTTNSLVALWRDGRAELVPNALGEFLTPSCVSLDDDGRVLVGQAARERLQTHPLRSAAQFKRFMGSDKTVSLGSKALRAEELSALVLKSLKADAEALLGEPVERAVITVPAYFSDAQRKATRAAGELAGLRVERLLNEPTAAALAYGLHQRDSETRFLVVDLGGGTFDVSILDLYEGVMEVRASAGDNFLGGDDFDAKVVDWFYQQCPEAAAHRQDPHVAQRLLAQAEQAKRRLVEHESAELRLRAPSGEFTALLSATSFESLTAPLLQRLRTPIERALRDARLRSSEMQAIVLAGGATRMPMVRRLVTTLFGRFPLVELNPDQIVALGAAVQAGLLMQDKALREVVMTDVAPYSMGVGISVQLPNGSNSHGHFDPIIERNTVVPASRVKTYWPTSDHQAAVDLQIYQGEARMVRDNIELGQLHVPLPKARVQQSAVEVRFTYDVSGLLQVEARVQGRDELLSLTIEGNPGLLSPDELAARMRELAKLKIHPRDQTENRALLARGERLFAQALGREREWLGMHTLAFEQALGTQDAHEIKAASRRYMQVLEQFERGGPWDAGS